MNLFNRAFRKVIAPLALVVVFHPGVAVAGEPLVAVVGEAANSGELARALAKQKVVVRPLAVDSMSQLGAMSPDVIVLASEKCLPPAIRAEIVRYLSAGGQIAFVGPQLFDYSPHAISPSLLPAMGVEGANMTSSPAAGGGDAGSNEDVLRREILAPDGSWATEFESVVAGMPTFSVNFNAENVRRPGRNVLQFWARGDAYMDLLTIEARDSNNRLWTAFVELRGTWRKSSVSLADFLPDGWGQADDPYPLLDPSTVRTFGFGPNRKVLWNEKPMKFAIGGVALAEGGAGLYSPTSALLPLRIAYEQIGTRFPTWLFDPFANATRVADPAELRRVESGLKVAVGAEILQNAFCCPVPYVERSGTRMGTDTKDEMMLKFMRESRQIDILGLISKSGSASSTVADWQIYSEGRFRGASIARFGWEPDVFFRSPALVEVLGATVARMAAKPKIAGVTPGIALIDGSDEKASPSLRVVLQNPLNREVIGNVRAEVAHGSISGSARFILPPKSTKDFRLSLGEVPQNFPFADFEWRLELTSDAGGDLLVDRVNLERGLLHACRAMLAAQNAYPDGRISNHYFGDAYGARAMIAYADLLRRQPTRLQSNRDLWGMLAPDEIEKGGQRFFDMLVKRQSPDGRFPMGYGEHTNSVNIADCGQMALNLAVASTIVPETAKRESYRLACRKFLDCAEQFYIDEAAARKLVVQFPENAKKGEVVVGHYGLGWGKGKKMLTGPSWVMPDILGAQVVMGQLDDSQEYRRLSHRNINAYLDSGYSSTGYFQAEALWWTYMMTDSVKEQERIKASLRTSFLTGLFKAGENDMYNVGGRTFLKGLPLVYYRRSIEDNASLRAVQFKYAWAFASENAPNSMRRIAAGFAKPIHGEALAAIKQAECGAIWAIEMIDSGGSVIRSEGFRNRLLDTGR